MTDLKTDAAESALREHLEVTRAARGADPAGAGWVTNYHQTLADLRGELMEASLMFHEMGELHRKVARGWLDERRCLPPGTEPEAPRPVAAMDADVATLMASSYAYTLAAIIRFAGEHFGPEVANGIAFEIDEILTNGDFDGLNADVMPEGKSAPGATQGIGLVIPASPAESVTGDARH
jgi:hypothetical protein